ncbi:MAG: response regulator, partial [Planctomycetes bacterium]|nr:response regulator [Planctomycetota bacterium]
APPAPPPAAAATGRHVLLVDDDAAVRQPLALALANAGFRVTAAADADEALAALRGGARCEVLLTDVRMPGLSGPQLAAAVEREFGAVPVLFLSGHTDDPALRSGQLPARRCFLSKPVAVGALVTALRTLLPG